MSISSKVSKLLFASALTMALAVPSFAANRPNFREHEHGRPFAQHREPRHEARHEVRREHRREAAYREHRREVAHREHRREVAYREHRHVEPQRRPAGWDHGKKTGWDNHNVPPGQANKQGSRPVFAHDRVHHHDPVYRSGAPAPVATNAPRPTVVYGKPTPSRTTQGGPPTVFGSKRQN